MLSRAMAGKSRRGADGSRQPAGQRGGMTHNMQSIAHEPVTTTTTSSGRTTRMSRLTVPALAIAFLIGVVKGAVEYSHRSRLLEPHLPGTNAITIHVVLAIAAATVVITIQARRARPGSERGTSPWTAPFSSNAAARLGRTIRLSRGAAAARILPMALLLLVLVYCPFRMGAQVIGGFDPDSTVNAWGGPSYAGALLAHWLDCVVGFYAAAFLLGRLLKPGKR